MPIVSGILEVILPYLKLRFESQDMSREQATPKNGVTAQVVSLKRHADSKII